jgi:hypothetical protein
MRDRDRGETKSKIQRKRDRGGSKKGSDIGN